MKSEKESGCGSPETPYCDPEDVVVLGFRNKADSVGTTDCLSAALELNIHNVFVFDAYPTAYRPFEWRYF